MDFDVTIRVSVFTGEAFAEHFGRRKQFAQGFQDVAALFARNRHHAVQIAEGPGMPCAPERAATGAEMAGGKFCPRSLAMRRSRSVVVEEHALVFEERHDLVVS